MPPVPTPAPPLPLDQLGATTLAAMIESALDGVLVVDAGRRVRYASHAACEIAGLPRDCLVGADLLASIAGPERADAAAHLVVGAGARSERRSTIIVRPDGERREVEYAVTGITSGGEPLALLTMRDVTETRRVVRWSAALAQITSSVAYAGTFEGTFGALARTLVRVTGISACLVVLIDGAERGVWRAAATCGLPEGYTDALKAVWREGVLLPSVEAFELRQPVLIRDVRRRVLEEPRCAPLHPFLAAAPWDVLLAVPLVVRGRPIGTLVGYYVPEHTPGEEEIAFLSIIADQAAVVVENARLFVEAQGKAALEERQKLARELHDSVSQALYGIALGARTARELLDRDPPRAAGPLDYVASLAEAGLAEMRALIFELRPESLASEGLVAALSKQSASLHARHGITVRTGLCEEPDVPLHIKEALYRIAQEALHNIVRHARASEVTLTLRTEGPGLGAETTADAPQAQSSVLRPPSLLLVVQDNGIGFDPGGAFPGHLGLRSMRERALGLGGTLEIESAPGAGTRITARIPR
ncbi:MAG TPA: histidine kinase [Roseiflexaceae bacterium]|nr:histidine kinase [Roseiflexaceae bacterium]